MTPEFPRAGPGYGGSCFPQGHDGAGPDRGRMRARPCASSRRWWRSTTSASAPWAARSSRACGGSVRGKTIASARPHLQAKHRRHARRAVAGHHHRAAGCRRTRGPPYDPEGMDQARSHARPCRPTAPDPYACVEGADEPRHRHRMGRVRAMDLGRVHGAAEEAPSWSTCATSTAPRTCASAASSMSASGGGDLPASYVTSGRELIMVRPGDTSGRTRCRPSSSKSSASSARPTTWRARLADARVASEIYSTAGNFDILAKFHVDDGVDIGHFVGPEGPGDTRHRGYPHHHHLQGVLSARIETGAPLPVACARRAAP